MKILPENKSIRFREKKTYLRKLSGLQKFLAYKLFTEGKYDESRHNHQNENSRY